MGLLIQLQDEDGKRIGEPLADDRNLLHQLLTMSYDGDILSGIDWYGDTTLNRLQSSQFLNAWEALISRFIQVDERSFLLAVSNLAKAVQQKTHTYLKFIGD